MSSDGTGNFEVEITPYAQRHFIKSFSKKYKKAWEITQTAILREVERIDNVIGETNRAETIKCQENILIVKLYFRVAGTKDSAKGSGNRAIIFVDNKVCECKILLIYSKNEICQPNETQKWENIVKENYPEIWGQF